MFYLNQFPSHVILSEVTDRGTPALAASILGSARALACTFRRPRRNSWQEKIRDGEDAIAGTRGRVRSPDYPPKAFKPVISRPMIKV